MRLSGIVITASLTAFTASAAMAETIERYQLEPTEDGYVRMDTGTGQMSICQERGDQLVCRMAADDRTAYEDELRRLQQRMDALERRVDSLQSGGPDVAEEMPSDEEVDRTLGIMEKFFRRFMGIVREFDEETPKTGTPAPDRT